MERCLNGSSRSSQFQRQFQLWYATPGLSCRPSCMIGCRISNARVFKLPDFVHWGSYYRRQPVRQAGGQQPLRQLLRYQDWSYARWPCYSFSATEHNSRHSALHIALTPNGNRPRTDVLHIIKHRSTTPKSMTPTAPSCVYNSWRSTWSETYFRQDLRGQRPISVKNAL